MGHGVRPPASVACASLDSYAPAMSLSGHWPWDSVISYWLLIFRDYWLYVIINISVGGELFRFGEIIFVPYYQLVSGIVSY